MEQEADSLNGIPRWENGRKSSLETMERHSASIKEESPCQARAPSSGRLSPTNNASSAAVSSEG